MTQHIYCVKYVKILKMSQSTMSLAEKPTAIRQIAQKVHLNGTSLFVKRVTSAEHYSHLLYSHSHSLIHSFTHSLIHSFTHSLIHSFTHSLIHSFTHSLIHSFTHSLIHSVTQSLSHSVTQSLSHSVTQSLTHVMSATVVDHLWPTICGFICPSPGPSVYTSLVLPSLSLCTFLHAVRACCCGFPLLVPPCVRCHNVVLEAMLSLYL